MSPVASPPSPGHPQLGRHISHARPRCRKVVHPRRPRGFGDVRRLDSYVDDEGRLRELVVLPGHEGSVLVLDRDAVTLCERRLVAHLAADEPYENAELVCRHYLQDTHGRWCRGVRPEDLETEPLALSQYEEHDDLQPQHSCVVDRDGNAYRLGLLQGKRSTLQMRWCRCSAQADDCSWEQTNLRDVIAALESYEPMRTLTEQAVSRYSDDSSVTRLRGELDRLCASPVVLNRGLREVLNAIDQRGTSMSEIALRCGIVKRDRRGNISGETSWLARRIGIMPEGGRTAITPWIHSDVLGAIARKGLGISPREVELQ
jgi:hypothetical protein